MIFKKRADKTKRIHTCERGTCCIYVVAYGVGVGLLFVCDDHLSPSNSFGYLWRM